VDEIDNSLERIGIGGWKDAMAKVEDVARASASGIQDPASGRVEDLFGGEGQCRIKISLQRNSVADSSACFIEWNSPVDADNVRARGCHEAEELASAHTEQRSWNTEVFRGVHDGFGGGKGEAFILRGAE
jgi:hypothetical protein